MLLSKQPRFIQTSQKTSHPHWHHSSEEAWLFLPLLFFIHDNDWKCTREWMALGAIKAKVHWQLTVWITSKEPVCCIYIPDTFRSTVHSLHCSSDTNERQERNKINVSVLGQQEKETLTLNEQKEDGDITPIHLDYNPNQMKKKKTHCKQHILDTRTR